MDAGFLDNSLAIGPKRLKWTQDVGKYMSRALIHEPAVYQLWFINFEPSEAVPTGDARVYNLFEPNNDFGDAAYIGNGFIWKRLFIRGRFDFPQGFGFGIHMRFIIVYDRQGEAFDGDQPETVSFSDIMEDDYTFTGDPDIDPSFVSWTLSYPTKRRESRFQVLFDRSFYFPRRPVNYSITRGRFPAAQAITNHNEVPPVIGGAQAGYDINFDIPIDGIGNILATTEPSGYPEYKFTPENFQFDELIDINLPCKLTKGAEGPFVPAQYTTGPIRYCCVWSWDIAFNDIETWEDVVNPQVVPHFTLNARAEIDDGKPKYKTY